MSSPLHRLCLSPSKYANAAARPRANSHLRKWRWCCLGGWASLLISACGHVAASRFCGSSASWRKEVKSRMYAPRTSPRCAPYIRSPPRQGCVLSVRSLTIQEVPSSSGAVQQNAHFGGFKSRCCAREPDIACWDSFLECIFHDILWVSDTCFSPYFNSVSYEWTRWRGTSVDEGDRAAAADAIASSTAIEALPVKHLDSLRTTAAGMPD